MSETAETENVTGESGSATGKDRIASWLVSKGCGAWKHPKTGEIRIYLNSFGKDLLEIECEYHKTGSLASFSMFGAVRSNSCGYKILRALRKCYYSPESGRFVCNGRKDDAEETGEMLMEAAEEKIRAEGYCGDAEENGVINVQREKK